MNSMFYAIISKYKHWKEQRFFKKHGVCSWEQFNRKYDVDFDNSAHFVKDMFHGYNTIILVPNPQMIFDFFGTTIYSSRVGDWCNENCVDKYRLQLVSIVEDINGELIYGAAYGSEELVIGFKSEEDASLFLLTYDAPEMNGKGKFNVVKIN